MREVDFSERTIAERWRQVKGVFREDLTVWTCHLLKRLLEGCLEEELEVYLRAAPHARTPTRRDYRNGTYPRDLSTEVGLVQDLRVPRARGSGFQPQSLIRYARRRPAVSALLRSCFLTGRAPGGSAPSSPRSWGRQ